MNLKMPSPLVIAMITLALIVVLWIGVNQFKNWKAPAPVPVAPPARSVEAVRNSLLPTPAVHDYIRPQTSLDVYPVASSPSDYGVPPSVGPQVDDP